MSLNSDWLAFLGQYGAVSEAGTVLHFGDPEQEHRTALAGDVLCDLSATGLIKVTGPDTETFLQGQLTSDVRQLTPAQSQLSAFCSPKGRILTCLRLFRRDDHYYLRLPLERLEPILKRLRMFVLRSQVTLTDAGDELVSLGLAGPQVVQGLTDYLGTVPSTVDTVVQTQGLTVIRVPGLYPRFEVYGELDSCQKFWVALCQHMRPVGNEAWRLLDIVAGVPNVYAATAEAFVPQMVNLQLLHGISFQKGCYTGQEIVARTRYLGVLKRRMYRAHVETESHPRPGDGVFSSQTGAEVGKIVDACRHPDGGYEALAVVMIEHADSGELGLGDGNGVRLVFGTLPYGFEEATASK